MIFCKYQNCCNFIVSILGANVTGDLYNVTGGGRENDMASLTHRDAAKVTAPECQHHHRTGQDNRTSKRQDQHWNVLRKIISLLQVPGDTREQTANPTAENTRVRTQGTLPSPQQHISAHKMFTIITSLSFLFK